MPILAKIWMVLLSKFHCLSNFFFFWVGGPWLSKSQFRSINLTCSKRFRSFKDCSHSRIGGRIIQEIIRIVQSYGPTRSWFLTIFLSLTETQMKNNVSIRFMRRKRESFYKIYPKNTHTFARQRDENQKVKEVAQIFILHSHLCFIVHRIAVKTLS